MWDNPWLALLWVVVCVAVILGLAYWFTRYVAARGLPGGFGGSGTERLQVLERLSLGKDSSLAVVRAGERCFLLGITPAGVSNLAEFTEEEAGAWMTAAEEQPVPSGFGEALRTVIRQKKR